MNYLKNILIVSLLLCVMLLTGCKTEDVALAPTKPINQIETVNTAPTPNTIDLLGPKYHGQILAGKESPYIDFNNDDYIEATDDGKIILLYFYATWSTQSVSDQRKIYDVFDGLTSPEIIGFRVNFNDDNTDAVEKQLATDFKVESAQTKIILKDGKVLQQSTNSWDKSTYLAQLTLPLDK
jgi:hypothetical protein